MRANFKNYYYIHTDDLKNQFNYIKDIVKNEIWII